MPTQKKITCRNNSKQKTLKSSHAKKIQKRRSKHTKKCSFHNKRYTLLKKKDKKNVSSYHKYKGGYNAYRNIDELKKDIVKFLQSESQFPTDSFKMICFIIS